MKSGVSAGRKRRSADSMTGRVCMWKVSDDIRMKIKEAADVISAAGSVYIFSHIVADGDALGSCAALCHALRMQGKEADILFEDDIPDNLKFLDRGYVTFVDENTRMPERDLCIALDCSSPSRFPKRENLYYHAGKKTVCIDHHISRGEMADISYIDSSASATAEIVYELLLCMGISLDQETGEAVYTGIATDTGNFQYTNTTKKTHLIAAELYDLGIDTKKINVILYQSVRMQKLKLHNLIMSNLDIFCGGLASMAYVTLDMYREADAKVDESDGINAVLRDISGVEIGIFFREKHPDEVKVGMRSKKYIDVSEICAKFGGGGHKHAAGCTIHESLEETIPKIRRAAEEAIEAFRTRNPGLLENPEY